MISNLPPGVTDAMIERAFGDAPEPDDRHYEKAEALIWPFLDWDESATFTDLANAAEYLGHLDEVCQMLDIAEACDKPAPVLAIPDHLRKKISIQARDWADEKALDIAADDEDLERDRREAELESRWEADRER